MMILPSRMANFVAKILRRYDKDAWKMASYLQILNFHLMISPCIFLKKCHLLLNGNEHRKLQRMLVYSKVERQGLTSIKVHWAIAGFLHQLLLLLHRKQWMFSIIALTWRRIIRRLLSRATSTIFTSLINGIQFE